MKKLVLFLGLALIIGIFVAGCVGSSRGNERKCGTVSYDPMEQVCCGNTLHTSTRSADWFCCGEDYVDIDSTTIECCGSTAINKATQHCCNGQVSPGAESDNWDGCFKFWAKCNGEIYNSVTHDCCKGVIYNKTSQSCCNGNVLYGDGWFVCDGQCIDAYRQSCCTIEANKRTIHDGAQSCCVGRPAEINGTYCQPSSGLYYARGANGYCVEMYAGHISCTSW